MKSIVTEIVMKNDKVKVIILRVIPDQNIVQFSTKQTDEEICIGSETLDEQMEIKLKKLAPGVNKSQISKVKNWVYENIS